MNNPGAEPRGILSIKGRGGFHLRNDARGKEWNTQTGKDHFMTAPLPKQDVEKGQFSLMTIRSHDQYNTTIYGLNDRHRGIKENVK